MGARMNPSHCGAVAASLSLRPGQVSAVASLLEGGATVPFIARYRKEATGELDEVAIAAVRDALDRLRALDDRRAAVLASLEERGLLTDELRAKVEACESLARLEDVYLPYRPKRRTRAQVARERGLAPLAADLLAQESPLSPEELAAPYVDDAKEVPDAEAALAGARDIVAEQVAEDADLRAELRALFDESGSATSAVVPGKEEEGAKFRDYFAASEPLRRRRTRRRSSATATSRARARSPTRSRRRATRPTRASSPPRWRSRRDSARSRGRATRPSPSSPPTCGSC